MELVGRVIHAEERIALVELPDGTTMSLSRDALRQPWNWSSFIKVGADVLITGVESDGSDIVTEACPAPVGAYDEWIDAIGREKRAADLAFRRSPAGIRHEKVIEDADLAIIYTRRRTKTRRELEAETYAAMNSAYEMSVSDFDGHEGDWE